MKESSPVGAGALFADIALMLVLTVAFLIEGYLVAAILGSGVTSDPDLGFFVYVPALFFFAVIVGIVSFLRWGGFRRLGRPKS